MGELVTLIDRAAGRPTRPDEAVGFLYHAATDRVLLNLRATDKWVHAGKWAYFGGRAEPEDTDLVATWCRELREELGAVVDPDAAVLLREGVFDDGVRWAEFWCPWPATDDAFDLSEGQAYAWLTVAEALAHPDIAAYVPDSLRLFRDRRHQEGRR